MRLSELQHKDIVSINDGKKIGTIIDVIINEKGLLDSLVVEKSIFLISMFTNKNEISVKWDQIKKIGEDVILVNLSL